MSEPKPTYEVPNQTVAPVEYLGDGLYAKFEDGEIVLLANDPREPTDKIYLAYPDVYNAMVRFVNRKLAAQQEQP